MSDESADRDSRLDWYMRTAVAAAAESLAQGYALTLVPPSDQQNWVQNRTVDGVLLVDPDPDDGLVTALADRGLPVVLISGDTERQDVATVSLDRGSAVECAMSHFLARGYTRPALIVDSSRRRTAVGTHRAFLDWFARQGVSQPNFFKVFCTVRKVRVVMSLPYFFSSHAMKFVVFGCVLSMTERMAAAGLS